MKVYELSLEEYMLLGGLVENININTAKCIYIDRNKEKKIAKINKVKNSKCAFGLPMIQVTFEDGTIKNYSSHWIRIKVEFVLSRRYLINKKP